MLKNVTKKVDCLALLRLPNLPKIIMNVYAFVSKKKVPVLVLLLMSPKKSACIFRHVTILIKGI